MQEKQRSARHLLREWKKYLPRHTVVMARKKVQSVQVQRQDTRSSELVVRGPRRAPLAFVTCDSDAFEGATGALLTKMIEALRLRRDEVGVMALRGGEGAMNARARLLELEPRAVVVLGVSAARALVGSELSPGESASLGGASVFVTYALEQLLADPSAKKETWTHLKTALAQAQLSHE
jgi:uracil-DNA glycosylase